MATFNIDTETHFKVKIQHVMEIKFGTYTTVHILVHILERYEMVTFVIENIRIE